MAGLGGSNEGGESEWRKKVGAERFMLELLGKTDYTAGSEDML